MVIGQSVALVTAAKLISFIRKM